MVVGVQKAEVKWSPI